MQMLIKPAPDQAMIDIDPHWSLSYHLNSAKSIRTAYID